MLSTRLITRRSQDAPNNFKDGQLIELYMTLRLVFLIVMFRDVLSNFGEFFRVEDLIWGRSALGKQWYTILKSHYYLLKEVL